MQALSDVPDKKFYSFLLLSLLLHMAGGYFLYRYPPRIPKSEPKPIEVDLSQIQLPPPFPNKPEVLKPLPELRKDPVTLSLGRKRGSVPEPASVTPAVPRPPAQAPSSAEPFAKSPSRQDIPPEGLLRPDSASQRIDVAKLYPSSRTLAKVEEDYSRRQKELAREAGADVYNPEDLILGSFSRRFESAMQEAWRPPTLETLQYGVAYVLIVFNREGEIIRKDMLQSSGSTSFDAEVRRTLASIGKVGRLPQAYRKETYPVVYGFVPVASNGRAARIRVY